MIYSKANSSGPRQDQGWFPSILLFLSVTCLLGGVSCQKEVVDLKTSGLPTNAVAQVGDSIISLEQFQTLLNQRSRGHSEQFASLEGVESILKELIQEEVLYQRAKAEGYETNAEMVATIKRMMIHKYQEDRLKELTGSSVTVSDEEINAYYQEHAVEYTTPEQKMGAIIFISAPGSDAARKIEIERKIQEIRIEAMDTQPKETVRFGFGALAVKHSEDQTTRYQGGKMGWLQNRPHGRWDDLVVEALFALEREGEISPIIATAKGYYLVKLVDAKPLTVRPLSQVQEGIRYKIGRENKQRAQEEFYATQKAQVEIRINQALLEVTQPQPAPSRLRPPGTPGT
jgi:parvulin-like peptidyl-prolyl isomerase